MVKPAPKLDRRTATDITRQVQTLLGDYASEWQEFKIDPATGDRIPTGISAALIGIFARFAEIIIQRLNRVPDKNFLAFLNLLGASRLPPQPARVPLTFSLAAGSTQAIVPAGTQVAAPPAEGETDPVIYETESELVVTAAAFVAAYARDLAFDRYADHHALVRNNLIQDNLIPTALAKTVFQCDRPIQHIFYLTHHSYYELNQIKGIRLGITLSPTVMTPEDGRSSVVWEYFDGNQFIPLTPIEDRTQELTRSEVIIFGDIDHTRDSASLPELKPLAINQQTERWLRCRLITPITTTTQKKAGMVRASQLPTITGVQTQVAIRRTGLLPDAAFANQTPIDLNKSILPFGEKPKLGDTFYLACREGFAYSGAVITLHFTLFRDLTAATAKLQWSFWNGTTWSELAVRDSTNALTKTETVSFTLPSQPVLNRVNGVESFWLRVQINSGNYGREATFAPRISSGNQSRQPTIREIQGRRVLIDDQGRRVVVDDQGRWILIDDQDRQIMDFVPATFVSPILSGVSITYGFVTANESPTTLLTENRLDYRQISADQEFQPFDSIAGEERPALHLGFQIPPNLQLDNRVLSLFIQPNTASYGAQEIPIDPSQSYVMQEAGTSAIHRLRITNPTEQSITYQLSILGNRWEVPLAIANLALDAGAIQSLDIPVTILDDAPANDRDRAFLILKNNTQEFTATLETVVASAQTSSQQPQLLWQYWNGQTWEKLTVEDRTNQLTRTGSVDFLPPTDWAAKDEFGQEKLHWLRIVWQQGTYSAPVQLQRILTNTAIATQTITLQDEILGSSDGTESQRFTTRRSPILTGQRLEVREPELPDAQGPSDQRQEVWVSWQEVPDFYGSNARDRHYTLDPITGEIQFGDGINGRIPLIGSGNLRLSYYQTGGGVVGNRPAGTIIQLKTTIPYIDGVINLEPAMGGAEAESIEALMERAPRTVRHGDRAVTIEDFEDLAMLASPEVARARCVPLLNLKADPLAILDNSPEHPPMLGEVSVIVVPRSTANPPQINLELLERVQTFLTSHASPTLNLSVVGPLYIRVSVTVEIVPTSLAVAGMVEQRVQQTLDRFLHPLTGGLDSNGWDFGREPHRSDFFALLEAIPGVDHIHSLQLDPDETPTSAIQAETPTPAIQAETPTPAIQAILNTKRFLVYSGPHTIRLIPP